MKHRYITMFIAFLGMNLIVAQNQTDLEGVSSELIDSLKENDTIKRIECMGINETNITSYD